MKFKLPYLMTVTGYKEIDAETFGEAREKLGKMKEKEMLENPTNCWIEYDAVI